MKWIMEGNQRLAASAAETHPGPAEVQGASTACSRAHTSSWVDRAGPPSPSSLLFFSESRAAECTVQSSHTVSQHPTTCSYQLCTSAADLTCTENIMFSVAGFYPLWLCRGEKMAGWEEWWGGWEVILRGLILMAFTAESPGFALRNFTESDGALFLFQLLVNSGLNYFFKQTEAHSCRVFTPHPLSLLEEPWWRV